MESSPQMYDNSERKAVPVTTGAAGSGAMKAVKTSPNNIPTSHSHNAEGELAELTSSEISLDLQGLIDDTQFDDNNLFVDLIDAKKNELAGYVMPNRTSPSNSMGSSGHSSPGGQDSPPSSFQYRNALAYIPGSVHTGATYTQMNVPPQSHNGPTSQQQQQQSLIHVKQEPQESDYGNSHGSAAGQQSQQHMAQSAAASSSGLNSQFQSSSSSSSSSSQSSAYSNGTVSSTTPSTPSSMHHGMGPNSFTHMGGNTPLPTLKSFASPPNYMKLHNNNNNHLTKKPKSEKSSDEYRRRRERNNVAVRKSREKAKVRTRETEERVKILARENERLQKKVELLQEELAVLRSLFSNVGVLPDHIHRELSKHMDNFQQQHNAMGCM